MLTGLVVVCILLVLAVFAAIVLKNLGYVGRSELGKGGRSAAHAGPEAQLDQLVVKGLEEIAKAKTDLEAEKELVISSQRRVDQNTAEETRLTNRIKAALSNGDPQGSSREYALSLAHVREQLASNQEQLAKHKANYEAYSRKVAIGQQQVLAAKQKAKEVGVELKESQREAELSEFADTFNVGDATSPVGDAISKMQERIYANKARTEVADEMKKHSLDEAKDNESEQQAKAEAILAEFAKK
jgi:phage shock protein A